MMTQEFSDEQKNLNNLIFLAHTHTKNLPAVVVNPFGHVPLSAMICFSTESPTHVSVKCNDWQYMSNLQNTHMLPIFGLKPCYQNKIVYTLANETEERHLFIETEELPEQIAKLDLIDVQNVALDKWFFVLPADEEHYAAAWDYQGNCCWYCTRKISHFMHKTKQGTFLVGGEPNLAPPYGPTPLWEIDLFGRLKKEYRLQDGISQDILEINHKEWIVVARDEYTNTPLSSCYKIEGDRGQSHLIFQADLYASPKMKSRDWAHIKSIYNHVDNHSLYIFMEKAQRLLVLDTDKETLLKDIDCKTISQYKILDLYPLNEKNTLLLQQTRNSVECLMLHENTPIKLCEREGKCLLSKIISLDENYIIHLGALDDATYSKHRLFSKMEGDFSLIHTKGVFLNQSLCKIGQYSLEIPTYGLWLYSPLDFSINYDKSVFLGEWKEALEIDVLLPIKEVDSIETLEIKWEITSDRLILIGSFLQGEAVACILEQDDKKYQYYIEANRWPQGTEWFYSNTERPERHVRWAIPIVDKKGKWKMSIWIDETCYIMENYIDF